MSYNSSDPTPVLTMENYFSWAKQMQWHIKGRNQGRILWSCVLESESFWERTPEEREEATARVQSLLMKAVPPVLEDTVHNAVSARGAWDTIKAFFEQGMQERKAHLLRQFLDMKQGSRTIPVFLLDLESKKLALREKCQYEVDEDLLMLVLTDAVRPEYMSKLDVVKLKDAYSYEDMKQSLIAEDARLRQQPGKALFTNRSAGANKDVTCFACGEKGHKRPECRASQAKKDAYRKMWLDKKKRDIGSSASAVGSTGICFTAYNGCPTSPLIYDSGATNHIVNDASYLHDMGSSNLSVIKAAGDEHHTVQGMGYILLKPPGLAIVKISNVHLVPSFTANLISGPSLDQAGATIRTCNGETQVHSSAGTVAFVAPLKHEQYVIKGHMLTAPDIAGKALSAKGSLWHNRLGHVHADAVRQMIRQNMTTGMKLDLKDIGHDACPTCIQAKHARAPFYKPRNPATSVLERVHTDVVGPLRTSSLGGAKYSLTMVDEFSSLSSVTLLSTKGEAGHALIEGLHKWQRLTGKSVKYVRSDRGGEFSSCMLESEFSKSGVTHEYTTAYTPQQNGVAERMNRTLFEKVRCSLMGANMPDEFWGLALQSASDIRNMCPVSGQYKTPFEMFYGRKPDLGMVRVFGCDCFVQVPNVHRRDPKLGQRSMPGMFVGYSLASKAWRVATIEGGRLLVKDSRDVVFVENKFSHGKRRISCDPSLGYVDAGVEDACEEHPCADDEQPDLVDVGLPEPPVTEAVGAPQPEGAAAPQVRQSNRENRGVPPDRFAFSAQGGLTDEPKTLKEVQSRPDYDMWKQSMDAEMAALMSMGVYEVVPTPEHARVLGCRWVYKIKRDQLGNTEKYKSRIVVKGFQQTAGIDYEAIFAPVSRHATVRIVLAIATVMDLEVQQVDVNSAFLNGKLKEETYMKFPPGYEIPGQVFLLKQALYGLKQAAREWYLELKGTLLSLGYTVADADPSLYIRGNGCELTLLLVYVDDVLIVGNKCSVDAAKNEFMGKYSSRDLGDVSYFLGFQVVRNRSAKTMWIGQSKLIIDTLQRYQLDTTNPTVLPMDAGLKMRSCTDDVDTATDKPYREVVGSLLYLASCTRPDIAYVVGVLSRFVAKPSNEHWAVAKRVLRYLRGTTDLGITYGPTSTSLEGFSDSDLGGDPDRRRSTSGSMFLLHGGAVLWTSALQRTVAASTCEAEYIAATQATKNALWLRKLLAGLSGRSALVPICVPIRGDNSAALALLNEPGSGSRAASKYIDLGYHFARDRVERGEVSFSYIPTADMLADAMTKALPKPSFCSSCKAWGMLDKPTP